MMNHSLLNDGFEAVAVYRPRLRSPGFGTIVYIVNKRTYVQDGESVIECDIDSEYLRKIDADYLEVSIEGEAKFAFEMPDGRMIAGGKKTVASTIRDSLETLFSFPFVLCDVADFLEDKKLKIKAEALCAQILRDDALKYHQSAAAVRQWLNGAPIASTLGRSKTTESGHDVPSDILAAREWLVHRFGVDCQSLAVVVYTPVFDTAVVEFGSRFNHILPELHRYYSVTEKGRRGCRQILWQLSLDLNKRGMWGGVSTIESSVNKSRISEYDKLILNRLVPNSRPKINKLPYSRHMSEIHFCINKHRMRSGLDVVTNIKTTWEMVIAFFGEDRRRDAASSTPLEGYPTLAFSH